MSLCQQKKTAYTRVLFPLVSRTEVEHTVELALVRHSVAIQDKTYIRAIDAHPVLEYYFVPFNTSAPRTHPHLSADNG